MDKIGAWAITEPDSGSDAFGSMKATARRDGDEYVLNGSKTFITNGPYADTIVFICKLDEGNPPAERTVLQFVLDSGHGGPRATEAVPQDGNPLEPDRHALPQRRAGRQGPPARGVARRPSRDRGGREASKATFSMERTGVAAMALGIVDRCLELCARLRPRARAVRPADRSVPADPAEAGQDGGRPHEPPEPGVPPHRDGRREGEAIDFAEASAAKLYSAQTATEVALEAVQLFGGNGYMAEYEVEQLARDAKVLQIYAGTDEIQISQIARIPAGRLIRAGPRADRWCAVAALRD